MRTITAAVLTDESTVQEASVLKVRKRDGSYAPFENSRIASAIHGAFAAENPKTAVDTLSADLTTQIVDSICAEISASGVISVEEIQDRVEQALMAAGHFAVAKRYIIYREEHARARALRSDQPEAAKSISYLQTGGELASLEEFGLRNILELCCAELSHTSAELLLTEVSSSLFDGIREDELDQLLILAARSKIEGEPEYAFAAARLLLRLIYQEVLGAKTGEPIALLHQQKFASYISEGIEAGRLSPDLAKFDLPRIAAALDIERDKLFVYMGMQTIYDRYLLHISRRRIETPQYFWMRVAMGLAMNEGAAKEDRAIEFYNLLSKFHFVSSTPTLFNSGTCRPQLSSCFLTTIPDDLSAIFKCIGDNAKLSKWAGGLGNDWTNIRATGARIGGTNGESQGIVPFLKVVNDAAVAVNQGGKRQGAVCAYLETWHMDIEEFLDLRKNTGDDRRRTHDMNTANWIPDLFIKRVRENGIWTLFTPDETPDLHDLYGIAFERRYAEYEQLAAEGKVRHFKTIQASELWRKMLSMLFETGHPWITFKDPSNIRSPQDHVGVVHSSNLCTEILLNTSATETAVCNLGSINLVAHVGKAGLNREQLARTVTTAVRMLDNVIDINFYPTPEAKESNVKHRPVGLGLMGFQDCLYEMKLSYASDEAMKFADETMEQIAYHAILASSELARERGTYQTYPGSKWSRGLLPQDSIALLEKERGMPIDVERGSSLDWEPVRMAVKDHGVRNSNIMAIAPTATIANIAGVGASIEPMFRNLYAKSNLSGDFTVINPYLVNDLRDAGLWDPHMIEELKYLDGSVQEIERIPAEIKERYRTAFQIHPAWLIEAAARRQKWIDMGQSLNLYVGSRSGKALNEMYMLAWEKGLKTTYYLRSQSATQIEKSTLDVNRFGIQPRWMKSKSASGEIDVERTASCSIDGGECEACQ